MDLGHKTKTSRNFLPSIARVHKLRRDRASRHRFIVPSALKLKIVQNFSKTRGMFTFLHACIAALTRGAL